MNNHPVLGFRISDLTVSITFDTGPVIITPDNRNFTKIVEALRSGDDTSVWDLANPAASIQSWFSDRVIVKNGALFLDGKVVSNGIVKTIFKMIDEGQDPEHLIRFLLLLEQNPSMNSRRQLWQFIEKNGIVIYSGAPVVVDKVINAPDTAVTRTSAIHVDMGGYLILYKGVDDNMMDCHSHSFLNEPGTVLSMPRSNVDDNVNAACSQGFHAGAFEYVKSFGERKLLVLVNPADIVSVPHDCSAQKVRTSCYTVLKEVDGGYKFKPLPSSVYDGLDDYEVTFSYLPDWQDDVYGDVEDPERETDSAIFRAASALEATSNAEDTLIKTYDAVDIESVKRL